MLTVGSPAGPGLDAFRSLIRDVRERKEVGSGGGGKGARGRGFVSILGGRKHAAGMVLRGGGVPGGCTLEVLGVVRMHVRERGGVVACTEGGCNLGYGGGGS